MVRYFKSGSYENIGVGLASRTSTKQEILNFGRRRARCHGTMTKDIMISHNQLRIPVSAGQRCSRLALS